MAEASKPNGLDERHDGEPAAGVLEFGGGILLILGLLTRIATLALVSVMIGAPALVHIPHGDPFVAPGKSSAELSCV